MDTLFLSVVLSVHKSISNQSEKWLLPLRTPQPIIGVAGLAAGKAGQSGRLPAESVGSALKVTWECFCYDYGM